MTNPTFFRLVATVKQFPSFSGLGNRSIRWVFWGKHGQTFSFPPTSVAMEEGVSIRQLRSPSMHTI
jgi:hypothetical protein